MKQEENASRTTTLIPLLMSIIIQAYNVQSFLDPMACKYGDRGSLTAICTNATPNLFRDTSYHFDHLDETLICLNCTLTRLKLGTFDIGGNRIQNLNLSSSRIEIIQEKSFTGLVFLERLILSNNDISRFEVGAFHGARKIKQIYLDNALTAPLPSLVFQDLWELKELYLKNNFLTALENKTFFGLRNLEILDLSHNKLKVVNESLIYLKSLKVLLLNNNEIFKVDASDFQDGLQNMLELDLSVNFIGSLNISLKNPNNLKKLNLSNNHLGNKVIKVGTFEHLNSLEILDLSLNWFKIIPPKIFRGLFNLRELILSNNAITRFESGAFTGLPSLRMLNVSHNDIEKAGITGRLSLSQLHIIDFTDNKISNFDFIKFLQRVPKISKIHLSNNLLNCEQRRRVEEYLKNENIGFELDLKNCPKLSEEKIKQIYKELEDAVLDQHNIPLIRTLKIICLLIVLSLIGILFYVHFFILIRRAY